MIADETNSAESENAINSDQPWLGLLPYSEEDAGVFYGRTKETAQLSQLIHRAALTVVFGRSGTGKSSLLNAGVFPQLRADRFLPVWIRLNYSAEFSHDDLIRSAVDKAVSVAGLETEVLNEPIAKGEETVWEYLHRVEFWDRRNQPVIPVLVFDQFEELFTLGRTRKGDQAFIEELADLVQNYIPQSIRDQLTSGGERLPSYYSDQRFKVVITLREDFVAKLDGLRKGMPSVMHNRFYLSQMNGEQALEVVRSPAGDLVDESVAREIVQFVSASLEGDAKSEIPHPVAEEVDLKSLQIEPALLSLVCRELNQRRIDQKAKKITLQQVRGSRDDILEGFYESSLEGLETRDRIFIEDRLVTASGFRSTVPMEDAELAGLSADDVTTLVNRRLIRREDRLGIPHIELTHDVLTGVVTRSRNERIKREEAAEAQRQKEKKAAEEIEASRQRLAKKLIVVFALISLVIAGLAIKLYDSLQEANFLEKKARARLQGLNAIVQGETDQELGLLLGIEAAMIDLKLNDRSGDQLGDGPKAASEIELALKTATRRSLIRKRFVSRDDLIYSVDFHPTKPIVVSSSSSSSNFNDATLEFWDVQTGTRLAALKHKLAEDADVSHSSPPCNSGAHFSRPTGNNNPERSRIITFRDGGFPRIWDAADLIKAAPRIEELENEIETLEEQKGLTTEQQKRLEGAKKEKQNLEDRALIATLRGQSEKDSRVTSAAFSPDGTVVATGDGRSLIRLWNSETGEEIAGSPLTHHDRRVRSIHFNLDSSQLLATSDDGKSTIWNLPLDPDLSNQPVVLDPFKATRPDSVERMNGGQFNPSGTLVATVDNQKYLRVWDSKNGNFLGQFRHPDIPMALEFYRDDRLVTVCNDSTIRFFDVLKPPAIQGNIPVRRLELIGSQRGHQGKVRSVAVSPNKDYILTGGEDSTVRMWKEPPGCEIAVLKSAFTQKKDEFEQKSRIFWSTDIYQYSDDRKLRAFSGNEFGQVNAWNVFEEKLLPDWKGSTQHEKPIRSLNISGDGTKFVTSSSDQTAILWDAGNGRALAKITGHRKAQGGSGGGIVYQARFSNDGKKIVTAAGDKTARVWTIPSPIDENEREIRQADLVLKPGLSDPKRRWSLVYDARFSPDDKLIVTADYDRKTATIWDLETRKFLKVLEERAKTPQGHSDIVLSASFSPDGTEVVTACVDGKCRVWSVESGKVIISINHNVSVRSAEFNSDGTMIVTAADDGNTRLWDRSTGMLLGVQKDHSLVCTQVRFRGNDSYLLTEGSDGSSTVSYLDAWSVYYLANQRITRKLTLKERIQFGISRKLTPDDEIPYYKNTEPKNLEHYLKHGTLPSSE